MSRIDEVKNRIKNKKNVEQVEKHNSFQVFMLKFFTVIIVFAFGTLIVKKDPKIKTIIYNKVYKNNFSFAYFKNLYNTHIGNLLPFKNLFNEKQVFSEKLEYKSLAKYNKGVKLTLENNYAIPIIKGGIVIFIGEKDNLGKTVIIQQSNGIDVWYSNLSSTKMQLYDYVETNSIVGEAINNTLYLTFLKDGVEIDYKEILK